eukprot:TRINITY_DN4820_c0_g1_i3.p1 TRINITY_DN4820_c0_g1~~TRINITY_DN4820_c0_g1_i3.p1  ORF type:complete len:411 (+),score=45.33 TRINITY_DN4820_c0_g1_i3:732-1964(+)
MKLFKAYKPHITTQVKNRIEIQSSRYLEIEQIIPRIEYYKKFADNEATLWLLIGVYSTKVFKYSYKSGWRLDPNISEEEFRVGIDLCNEFERMFTENIYRMQSIVLQDPSRLFNIYSALVDATRAALYASRDLEVEALHHVRKALDRYSVMYLPCHPMVFHTNLLLKVCSKFNDEESVDRVIKYLDLYSRSTDAVSEETSSPPLPKIELVEEVSPFPDSASSGEDSGNYATFTPPNKNIQYENWKEEKTSTDTIIHNTESTTSVQSYRSVVYDTDDTKSPPIPNVHDYHPQASYDATIYTKLTQYYPPTYDNPSSTWNQQSVYQEPTVYSQVNYYQHQHHHQSNFNIVDNNSTNVNCRDQYGEQYYSWDSNNTNNEPPYAELSNTRYHSQYNNEETSSYSFLHMDYMIKQ